MSFRMVRLFMPTKLLMIMRLKTCCKRSIIFNGFPCARSMRKELCHPLSFVQRYHRKRVETAGSLIAQLLPKSMHVVTSQGFELKVALFVVASSLNGYLHL
jgi:hypothetical protein